MFGSNYFAGSDIDLVLKVTPYQLFWKLTTSSSQCFRANFSYQSSEFLYARIVAEFFLVFSFSYKLPTDVKLDTVPISKY